MILNFDTQRDKTISLQEKGKIHNIPLQEICYIKSNDYLITVYTNNKINNVTFTGKLKEFEAYLDKYAFVKINRSCLVNIYKIQTFDCVQHIVILENYELNVFRTYTKKLRKCLICSN